jgi:hypothetical protein
VVRRLSDAGTPYGAEWTSVLDSSTRRTLDLHDPFETEERWGAVRLDRNPYTDTLFGT